MSDDRERIIAALLNNGHHPFTQQSDLICDICKSDHMTYSATDDEDAAHLADVLLPVVNDLRADAWDECEAVLSAAFRKSQVTYRGQVDNPYRAHDERGESA